MVESNSTNTLTVTRRSTAGILLAVLSGCVDTGGGNQTNSSADKTMNIEDAYESATGVPVEESPPRQAVRVAENADTQTITVSKKLSLPNSCHSPDYTVDTDTANNRITVAFDSTDTSPDNVACAAAIQPSPLAVELRFSELPVGAEIAVTPIHTDDSVIYTASGKSKTTELAV